MKVDTFFPALDVQNIQIEPGSFCICVQCQAYGYVASMKFRSFLSKGFNLRYMGNYRKNVSFVKPGISRQYCFTCHRTIPDACERSSGLKKACLRQCAQCSTQTYPSKVKFRVFLRDHISLRPRIVREESSDSSEATQHLTLSSSSSQVSEDSSNESDSDSSDNGSTSSSDSGPDLRYNRIINMWTPVTSSESTQEEEEEKVKKVITGFESEYYDVSWGYIDFDKIDKDLICSICLQPLSPHPVISNCSDHMFCKDCLKFPEVSKCPLCRLACFPVRDAPVMVRNALGKLSIECWCCGEDTTREKLSDHVDCWT